MSLVEDEDVQRTGIVHIQYNMAAEEHGKPSTDTSAVETKEADDSRMVDDDDDDDDDNNSSSSSPAVASPTSLFKDLCQQGPSFLDALPIRIVAVHYCYDIESAQPDMDVYSVISRDLRCRIREHYGR